MKIIEEALSKVGGYLISIARDTVNGWYEIEVGLPAGWVFDENNKIGCEVLIDEDEGKLIKISPKIDGIVIDDLLDFLGIIIETNERIAKKEKEFTDEMDEMKEELEEKARNYFKELDDLKDESFKRAGSEFAKTLEIKPKKGRPKGSKNTPKVKKAEPNEPEVLKEVERVLKSIPAISTVIEETETISSSKE